MSKDVSGGYHVCCWRVFSRQRDLHIACRPYQSPTYKEGNGIGFRCVLVHFVVITLFLIRCLRFHLTGNQKYRDTIGIRRRDASRCVCSAWTRRCQADSDLTRNKIFGSCNLTIIKHSTFYAPYRRYHPHRESQNFPSLAQRALAR